MKILKLNTVKAKLSDAVSRNKTILYGYDFNNRLEQGDWTEAEIKKSLDKFFSGDWGKVSDKTKEINRKHVEAGKGNLTGIYQTSSRQSDDIIIFYSEYNDIIYILSSYDFDGVEEAWLPGDEKYVEEYTVERTAEGGEKYRSLQKGLKYNEPGHQLKREQKEYLRQKFSNKSLSEKEKEFKNAKSEFNALNAKLNKYGLTEEEESRLKELKKLLPKLEEEYDRQGVKAAQIYYPSTSAGSGAVHQSEIEAIKKTIETGYYDRKDKDGNLVKTNLPENAAEILKNLAIKYNVDYDDIIEKITEENVISNKNLLNAYNEVLKNIDKPYFFSDSKKPKWLEDEVIDDIVYSKKWPTTIDIVAKDLIKKGIKKDSAIRFVKDYLKNNPHEKKHFKFNIRDKEIDLKELQDKIFTIMLNYAKELDYNDAEDFIAVDVVKEGNYIKIEIRNDLFGFYESDSLINELDKLVAKYDQDAYFEPYDEYVWQAYI